MPGSTTQGQPSDKRESSAAEHGAPSSAAATLVQPPRGDQDTQRQAADTAQAGGGLTEENERQISGAGVARRQPSDTLSQVCMSHIDVDEGFSGREEDFFDEEDLSEPWGIVQFLNDESNIPVWARPLHESREAAERFYRSRAVRHIRDFNNYVTVSQGR
ncbi:hypothetical protein A9K55_002597 [Cordyceps militaris]|uniref:Uncharacterized protein n=1 Tax=Cordyceps militaris TaxID=73501 RepID=A0A2H4S8F9_CORMI|nr:hypothetical protein A9K55_002597 [Cordyceps militaris]